LTVVSSLLFSGKKYPLGPQLFSFFPFFLFFRKTHHLSWHLRIHRPQLSSVARAKADEEREWTD